MYDRILVPLDGSDLARQALQYARTVAVAKSAEIELVEVIEPPEDLAKPYVGDYATMAAGMMADPWLTADRWAPDAGHIRNRARLELADAAAILGEGVSVSSEVLEGDAAEAIITEADRRPGTLIVMATHGRSGIGRWLLGSVTDKVVRHAEHPTLVVRVRDDSDAVPPTLREVILPLDGSANGEAAIPHAVEMAKVLGAGISLLRAVSPLSYGGAFEEYVPLGYERVSGSAREDAEDYLEAIAARLRNQGVASVNTAAMVGNAGSMIIEAARGSGDSLIVMATRGHSGVGRWVLGSVADRVVRHSLGPVLVVRPRPAA